MRKLLSIAAAGVISIATCASAKPFEPASISADAKWVMHVDIDAISKTNAWKLIEPKLLALPDFAKARADIERVGQVKLPGDLHDVTLYGPTFGESEAVVIINANVNDERLKTLVSLNESYTTETIGGQTIHSWQDNKQHLFGGFATDRRIVIGRAAESVIKALDVLGGKVETLQKSSLVPDAEKAGLLIYVAGDQLANLSKVGARSPMIQQLQKAWITVQENDRGMIISSQISANDQKVALNVKNAIEGVKAMISFAGQEDPDAMLLSDALLELNTKIQGNDVNIDWQVTTKTINEMLDRATGKIEKSSKVTAP